MLVSIAACNQTMAADAGKGYIGLGAGGTHFGYTSSQCSTDTGYNCTITSSDTGAKIFGGYNISPNAAVEVSYIDFGSLTGTVVAPGGNADLEESETAFSIALIGIAPVAKDFSLSAKVGYFSADASVTARGPGGSVTLSETARNFLIGAGAGFNFTPHVAGKIEFEHFVKAGDSESNIDLGSISLAYNF